MSILLVDHVKTTSADELDMADMVVSARGARKYRIHTGWMIIPMLSKCWDYFDINHYLGRGRERSSQLA